MVPSRSARWLIALPGLLFMLVGCGSKTTPPAGPTAAPLASIVVQPVHSIPSDKSSIQSYAKHHYDAAMRTQLEVGLFELCGIEERRFELLYGATEGEPHPSAALGA
jgi:hypothetical protein